MEFNVSAYPEVVTISGKEYEAQLDINRRVLKIPYTEAPEINNGDVITQKTESGDVPFGLVNFSFLEEASLLIGTDHPHILRIKININPGGHQAEENNANINFKEFVGKVASGNDPAAKSALTSLLRNRTVRKLLGPEASAMLRQL